MIKLWTNHEYKHKIFKIEIEGIQALKFIGRRLNRRKN